MLVECWTLPLSSPSVRRPQTPGLVFGHSEPRPKSDRAMLARSYREVAAAARPATSGAWTTKPPDSDDLYKFGPMDPH